MNNLDGQTKTAYSDYRVDEIRKNLSFFPMDIVLVGATGVGKSTTLNSLLGEDKAKVGFGVDPETKIIKEYMLNEYIRLWDTPGLGDNPKNDSSFIKEIEKLLNKKYNADNKTSGFVVDLVLILVDASSRDLGTLYSLLINAVYKNIDPERVLFIVNQADMAMSGRHWKDGKPDEKLEDFLEEQSLSIQRRIMETTGIKVKKPLCYSAANNFNLYSLLDYVIDNFKWDQRKTLFEKRIIEQENNHNQGEKDYGKKQIEKIAKPDELFKKMKKLIARKLDVDERKITMDASFRQDLGVDSLDTYELAFAIKEEMGVSIPDEKANEFETIRDAYEYIKSFRKVTQAKPKTVPTKTKLKCPSCGSQKVRVEKKGFRGGMLLLGVIGAIAEGIRSQKTQFVCQKCGHTWD